MGINYYTLWYGLNYSYLTCEAPSSTEALRPIGSDLDCLLNNIYDNVTNWLKILENALLDASRHILPEILYNVDETCICP